MSDSTRELAGGDTADSAGAPPGASPRTGVTVGGLRAPRRRTGKHSDDGHDLSVIGGLSALRTFKDTVNIAICDGSVRSVKVDIAKNVWEALSTRNGGEAIPAF